MATKAPGKQNVVTLKHLAAALAEVHEVPKKKSVEILTDLVGLLTKHLKTMIKTRFMGRPNMP